VPERRRATPKPRDTGASERVGTRVARVRGWLATAVSVVVGFVAFVLVLAAVLVLLEANRDNAIVDTIVGWGESWVGPFRDMFTFDDANRTFAVNAIIAAIVYLVLGRFVARIIR
jgi:uncharacterized membrane protein YqiK